MTRIHVSKKGVATAAHCTNFFNSNSFQVLATPGMNVYVNGTVVGRTYL